MTDMTLNIEQLIRESVDNIRRDVTNEIKRQIVGQNIAGQIDVNQLVASTVNEFKDSIVAQVIDKINNIDLTTFVSDEEISKLVSDKLQDKISTTDLKAIINEYLQGFVNNVNFQLKGIDDTQATGKKVVVTDSHTAVENLLITKAVAIQGDLQVGGAVTLNNGINSDSPGFQTLINNIIDYIVQNKCEQFVGSLLEQANQTSFKVNNITVNGQPLIENRKLSNQVLESSLRKLGPLENLRVLGEAEFGENIYIGRGKIGINNNEPSDVLDVWDGEVQVSFKKIGANKGLIGTSKSQELVLGVNGQQNIVLMPDGSANIEKIRMKDISIGVTGSSPSFEGTAGDILFNMSPDAGGPVGWQCLGGARWREFK